MTQKETEPTESEVSAVEDALNRWSIRVKFGRRPFSMFFLAGQETATTLVVDEFAKKLEVPEGSRMEMEVNAQTESNLTAELLRRADEVKGKRGTTVLIVARGFEEVVSEAQKVRNAGRVGHDWCQDVMENPPEAYLHMGKTVVIVTVIPKGEPGYEDALRSAAGSRRTSGPIIELTRETPESIVSGTSHA